MSAEELERRLAELGVPGRVEARGKLAILSLENPGALAEAERRSAAVALAREQGFTHLALELGDDSDRRATVPRD
jgi:hypothetical protein